MRHTVFLLALILFTIVALPYAAVADEELQGDQGSSGGDKPCHEMNGDTSGHQGMEMPCCEDDDEEGEDDDGEMVATDEACSESGEAELGCPGEMTMDSETCDGSMDEAPWEMGWWGQGMGGRMARHMDSRWLDHKAMSFLKHVKSIAILPFLDLTSPSSDGNSVMEEMGGPRRIVDNLASEFMGRGYLVLPTTDVDTMYNSMLMDGETDNRPGMEAVNNELYVHNMPERAVNYYMSKVPGLGEQIYGGSGSAGLSTEDVMKLGELLGADAIIRGFVNEFAIEDDIEADWRTFVPPFLGLWNPDRKITVNVTYYLYDGSTGELIWNGNVEFQENNDYPFFNSDSELIWDSKHEVVWNMADHVLPNWQDLVMGHHGWMGEGMWEGDDCDWVSGCETAPDWVNPHRDGWHECYEQSELRISRDFVEPSGIRYRDGSHSYNGIRGWHQYPDY